MSLAHRSKINLNYPLPVSNDPNELIRQKWINDTYQTLKAILPPRSVDTPEELAQLSQFVINIVDFRDPDATMTHWTNPDVLFVPGTKAPAAAPYVVMTSATPPAGSIPLDQYGMEYNPVAINEVMAYSFQRNKGGRHYGDAPVFHRAGEHSDFARDSGGSQQRQYDRPEWFSLDQRCTDAAHALGRRELGHHHYQRRPAQPARSHQRPASVRWKRFTASSR